MCSLLISLRVSVSILKMQLYILCLVPLTHSLSLSPFHSVSPSPKEKKRTIESQMRKMDKNSSVNDRKNEFPRHSQLAVRYTNSPII